MVKYFTIIGERCSGTNFLEQAIKSNFELELIWHYGFKHFFGHYDYTKKNSIIKNDDDVLFLGIVREPISWINSFNNNKHHIPEENKKNIHNFLNNEFYSVNKNNDELLQDRNYKTKKRYKNIFELRDLKNEYLINHKDRVKNYLLIRYEDLVSNYDNLLYFIQQKYNLKKKYTIRLNKNQFIKIKTYKGDGKNPFYHKEIKLNNKIINYIKDNLNKEQEKSLGYI